MTIANTAYMAMAQGKTNDEVLAVIKEKHPEGHTTMACVQYYRSQLNTGKVQPPTKNGKKLPNRKAALLKKLAEVENDMTELKKLISAA